MGLRDRWILGAYRAGASVVQSVPVPVTDLACSALGAVLGSLPGAPRDLVRRHQQRVDPSARRSVPRRVYRSYARYWAESLRLPQLPAERVSRGLTTEGYERHVLPALAEGRGVILALPHLGGWEWAGRWLADRGHRVTAVVERVEPPALFDWFVDLRSRLGMHIVPLDASAGREVLAALRNNEVVCLLCDRDLQHSGVEVDFLGERTTLPAGPATLALRTGAPLLPTAVYHSARRGEHHLGVVCPPLATDRRGALRDDVARVTQDLADQLAGLIARAPDQWHLLQPNWPSDRPST